MLLKKFRITHSTLIEHYQFIEGHLEGIYAAVSGKSFAAGVKEVENDSLGSLLKEIAGMQKEKGVEILSEEQFQSLREMIKRRNFWCHNCYFDLAFDLKVGGLAKVRDAQALLEDLKTAEIWRKRLFELKQRLLQEQNHG